MFWQKHFDKFVVRMRHADIPLRIRLWNGTEADLGAAPAAVLVVPTATALRHLFNPTLDNLGQAYVEGEIEVEGRLTDIVNATARLTAHASGRKRHRPPMIRHTREIDRQAVAYHYDVSNEFYSLWLDRNMVYSCGYFRSPDDSLDAAQMQKIDHILTKLRVQPGDRLLDIGCGWGALIMRAAEKYSAKAVGITLSQNQFELARERIAAAGLSGRCEVQMEDYRDVTGSFERIASVGMFEHVGLKNLRGYFIKVNQLLTGNGMVMNHGITSSDPDSGAPVLGGNDFIERYVFPHGKLPHLSLALKEMCAAGLEPVDVENLRRHYALTLTHWVERFEAAGEQVKIIAGEKRWRIWRTYLAGCAHGFANNWMTLYQILAVKGRANDLPLTRDYMYRG
ncbi:MAG: class I SAM-dependent methyltransferase [Betaproteobacteria bacterium]|nr:class I SAM-dependent methyltransferase [Betaproteobacteria bacterium]